MAERALTAATDLNSTLEHIAIHQRRNAIVFLISDFYCASFEHNLRNLSHRHDVIGVLVRDAIDAEIPEAGLVRVRDAETGGMRILDTRSQRVRSGLKTLQAKRTEQLRLQFRRVGADFIAIDNNPLRPLAELMQRRTRRH